MEYVGKHKINSKEVYKYNNKHYYLEGENFIKAEELSEEQKMMIKIIHEQGTDIKYSYDEVEKHCNDTGHYIGEYWFPFKRR